MTRDSTAIIDVDTSENPVQNKVIKKYVDELKAMHESNTKVGV